MAVKILPSSANISPREITENILSTINMEGKDSNQGDALETKKETATDKNERSNEVTKLKGEESEGVSATNNVLKTDAVTEKEKEKEKENENENENENDNDNDSKDKDSELPSTDKKTEEEITFKVIYNKNRYDITFPANNTVMQLKSHLQTVLGVPQAMQKVMIKGLAKDDRTLKELGVTKGAKIMVVGSKLDDVLSVSTPSQLDLAEDKASVLTKEPFCKQKMHRKVLDKGIPDDVMPGIKHMKESLPQFPISGMLNKHGGKVRLTFKLELDQVWIGTKERTDKIPMNSIKNVISEAIEDHEEYHIMALQLGPTEASRYWVYWVPAQYVDAIKDAILGSWPI